MNLTTPLELHIFTDPTGDEFNNPAGVKFTDPTGDEFNNPAGVKFTDPTGDEFNNPAGVKFTGDEFTDHAGVVLALIQKSVITIKRLGY